MIEPHNRRRTRLLLVVILFLYLLLATGYNVINPLFEAPDEIHHFFAVRYVAQTKSLPVTTSASYLERQEAAQPPLYYMLASTLVSLVDTSKAEEQLWFNPTVQTGRVQPININTQVHTSAHSWPWKEYPLAAHLVRALSTVIGLGTLLCIYGAGRLFWPDQPVVALLATALVAFLPQFGFLHGAVSNDVLIIFFSSFALWQMSWLWFNEITTARLLLLGVSIGLAVLSKMAGLALFPLALFVLALIAWRDRRRALEANQDASPDWWIGFLRSAVLVFLPALLISGWLLWRNWINYGDPSAANQFVRVAGGNRHYTLRQVWHDMDRVTLSVVAFFGWMNLLAPPWLYAVWGVIVLLAGGGWLFSALRRPSAAPENEQPPGGKMSDNRLAALWMGAWVLIVFLAWLRFMMQTPADQGRLLFPALLPVTLFLARGLVHWRLRWLPPGVAAAALVTSLYALFVLIPGTYNPAAVIAEEAISADAARVEHEMGFGMQLLAVEAVNDVLQPGDWAWVDLYWRADEPLNEAPMQSLALYGREHELIGHQRYFHGGGNQPASEWPVGQIVRDRVAVQLANDAELPVEARLLLDIDPDHDPVEIARFKAVPANWPAVEQAPLAVFGEGIELLAVSMSPDPAVPGSAVAVDLLWRVAEAPGRELTTFVHLGDPAQAPLAQGDGPALGGDYPVNLWADGEVIDDRYLLNIPHDLAAGEYPVHIGFYDPESGQRQAVAAGEQPTLPDAYFAGMLTVGTE